MWSHSFPAAGYADPHAIVFDAGGNLVLGGSFVGDLDAFVGKFSPAGAHLWSLPSATAAANTCRASPPTPPAMSTSPAAAR
ncbi:hypothetical protein [Nannocystis radixulma]|uniref:Uncharacterized protein n=1 Tax=Nannocystis radixulma TaxID=2995305 RepID=A0ABT5BI61_9BACT|nr:hypothetical protein [Nannocystis radixulma]MDC0672727.1 hypothetical protein [Nannocystis radixulma]